MDTAARTLQFATIGALMVASALALRDWLRDGDRLRGWLALALALIALAGGLVQVDRLTGHQYPPVTPGAMAALLLSGCALVMLLRSLLPVSLLVRCVAAGAVVASGVAAAIAHPPLGLPGSYDTTAWGAVVSTGALWTVCVVACAVRIRRAAGPRPAVQRARLRAVASGYLTILIVVVSSAGSMAAVLFLRPGVEAVAAQAVALALVPVQYFAFAPPLWLRRSWREREEEGLRRGIEDLLLYSPDRETLAARALEWALRLVGADSGLIADEQAQPLATIGIGADAGVDLARELSAAGGAHATRRRLIRLPGPDRRRAIVHALSLETGVGTLAVISGPYSPTFGGDETDRLEQYAGAIAVALDRARLVAAGRRSEGLLRTGRDAAEAASRAKSEFLSRMSHELRTPLTAILGFSDLLTMESLTPGQTEYVDAILRAGGHLLALINDVLDIARIEEGRVSLSLEPLEVDEVIAEVVGLTRGMAAERSVSLAAPEADASFRVLADHQRLKQVLLNLVTNAIKYNSAGGTVEIERGRTGDGSMRVSVRDSGPGIAAEDHVRLFAPFERLNAADTDVEGTGLGLALSRTLTEAMGGDIGIDSARGEGCTFWVDLPEAAATAAPRDGHTTERDPVYRSRAYPQPRRVLYVEDTASNVRLVQGILSRRSNLRLDIEGTAGGAITRIDEQPPDLVLLDLHLPDREGDVVLARVRTNPATARLPVVILSADATQNRIDRLLAEGANDYLTKPIDVNRLLTVLDSYLEASAIDLAGSSSDEPTKSGEDVRETEHPAPSSDVTTETPTAGASSLTISDLLRPSRAASAASDDARRSEKSRPETVSATPASMTDSDD